MSSQIIYALLGRISVTFATIEHRLLDLLDYLLAPGNCNLVKPYILDDLSLSRSIQKTRDVAKLRLWNHKPLFQELNTVLKEMDNLRVQRNFFIHGDWFQEGLTEDAKSVKVYDYRPRLDKKTGSWEYLESRQISDVELQEIYKKVDRTYHDIMAVSEKIRNVKLR